jgi:hypothetical protein
VGDSSSRCSILDICNLIHIPHIAAKTTFAIIDYVIDERHCCPRVNHGKCCAAVRDEGASGPNIRNRDEYHRCYGSLSQASRNIENCKLEMLQTPYRGGSDTPGLVGLG